MINKHPHLNQEYVSGFIDAVFWSIINNYRADLPKFLYDYNVVIRNSDNGYYRAIISFGIEGVCTKTSFFDFLKDCSTLEFLNKVEITIEQLFETSTQVINNPQEHKEKE